MSRCEIQFKTDNAAFCDGAGESEIARILRQLADKIEEGGRDDMQIYLADLNGNTVGHCFFTLPEPESSE